MNDDREKFEWANSWHELRGMLEDTGHTKSQMSYVLHGFQKGWEESRNQQSEGVRVLVEAVNAMLDAELIYTGAIEEPIRTCGIGRVQPYLDNVLAALKPFQTGEESLNKEIIKACKNKFGTWP